MSRTTNVIFAIGLSVVALAAVGGPLFGPSLAEVFRLAFSTLCHQDPARTFQVDGIGMAVCHRCAGIYVGLWITAAAILLLEPRFALRYARVALGLALLAVGLDWGLDAVGILTNSSVSRSVTGLILGSTSFSIAVSLPSPSTQPTNPECQ